MGRFETSHLRPNRPQGKFYYGMPETSDKRPLQQGASTSRQVPYNDYYGRYHQPEASTTYDRSRFECTEASTFQPQRPDVSLPPYGSNATKQGQKDIGPSMTQIRYEKPSANVDGRSKATSGRFEEPSGCLEPSTGRLGQSSGRFCHHSRPMDELNVQRTVDMATLMIKSMEQLPVAEKRPRDVSPEELLIAGRSEVSASINMSEDKASILGIKKQRKNPNLARSNSFPWSQMGYEGQLRIIQAQMKSIKQDLADLQRYNAKKCIMFQGSSIPHMSKTRTFLQFCTIYAWRSLIWSFWSRIYVSTF